MNVSKPLRLTLAFVHLAISLLTCLSLLAIASADWARALKDETLLVILLPTLAFNVAAVVLAVLAFSRRNPVLLAVEIGWTAFAAASLSWDFLTFALLTLALAITVYYLDAKTPIAARTIGSQ